MIRYFERRPEKYSHEDGKAAQTLLLLDEFARFGRLEMLSDAVSTLRSKNINMCFLIQSLAMLDEIYGEYDRRIICDNCHYKVILGANDVETQRYFADSIGTYRCKEFTVSQNFNQEMGCIGYNINVNETRDKIIQPHELATLRDVLVLSPDGFYRVKKVCFIILILKK